MNKLRVAIVEDSEQDAELLASHLQRYGRENALEIETLHFPNAILFLQQYRGDFGVVFMDIDMPALNGMNAARSLRELDAHVLLIFVTALARFAVNGYEVDAFDFVVKPVQYNFFAAKMNRAMKKLATADRTKILIRSGERSVRIYADEVIFVDIFNHVLSFHTQREVIATRGTIRDALSVLQGECFAMCNKSCIVNLNCVQQVEGDEVELTSGDRLQISRPRKTEFMQRIADFYGSRRVNMGRFDPQ